MAYNSYQELKELMNITSLASSRHPCAICGTPTGKRCSRCQNIFYCSVMCQSGAWSAHKPLCQKKITVESVESRLKRLEESMTEKELGGFHRMWKVQTNGWNTLEETPDYLQLLPESKEREFISLMIYEDETDFAASLFDGFGTIPGITIIQRSDCVDKSDDCAKYVFEKKRWYTDKDIPLRLIPKWGI